MKKKSNSFNGKKIKKGITSPNFNTNHKYDRIKLQSLLEDLIKKDLEYDLIIKGLKEKINTTKRESNVLEKEIEQLKLENDDIHKANRKLNFENDYKTKQIKNKVEFDKNLENLKKDNINIKYKKELDRNKVIKNKIANIQVEINGYKNRIVELESILNYTNPEIQKEGEDMKKFLSEL